MVIHIIAVGRNPAYCLLALYFSCTDQFGRILAVVLGVYEKLSAWFDVAKGRECFENVDVVGRVTLICMHVLMAKGVEYLTAVSWLRRGFSGDFW
jgi:drug/metabolite transporter superfamily protein YnfA